VPLARVVKAGYGSLRHQRSSPWLGVVSLRDLIPVALASCPVRSTSKFNACV
jgi:hypothetical protein